MRLLLLLLFLTLCSSAFAEDKGYNVAVDKATGKVVEYSYGDSGFQHRIDEGYDVVRGVPRVEGEIENMRWVDKNADGKTQPEEIVKRPLLEIKNIQTRKKQKELQARLVDLRVKSKEAAALGYVDIKTDMDSQIIILQNELNTP